MLRNIVYTFKYLVDRKIFTIILLLLSIVLGVGTYLIYSLLPVLIIAILEKDQDYNSAILNVVILSGVTLGLSTLKRQMDLHITHVMDMNRLTRGLDYYNKTMEIPYEYFDSENGKSEMHAGLQSYMDDYHSGFTNLIVDTKELIENFIGIIVSSIILTSINVYLGLFLITLSLLMIPIGNYHKMFVRKNRSQWNSLDSYRKELYNKIITVEAAKDMRIYHAKPWLDSIISKNISERVDWSVKESKSFLKQKMLEMLIMIGKYIGIFYYVYSQLGVLRITEVVFLLTISFSFSRWLDRIVDGINFLKINSEKIDETRFVLDQKFVEPLRSPNVDSKLGLSISNVSFSRNNKTILRDVTLDIKPGEKVSIVGFNGAGKTTLIKLITGLLKPDQGEITCTTKSNLDEFTPQPSFFSATFQDSDLTAFSIAENISCLSNDQINESKVIECLKKVDMLEFVEKLPDGIYTPVSKTLSESGVVFSEGQKQRILIAKCLYKDSPIIILDEPTASLDALSESKIYKLYRDLLEDKTVIFISHRLSSTLLTDTIFFLQNGRITERGSHEELMTKGASYAKLFNSQATKYVI